MILPLINRYIHSQQHFLCANYIDRIVRVRTILNSHLTSTIILTSDVKHDRLYTVIGYGWFPNEHKSERAIQPPQSHGHSALQRPTPNDASTFLYSGKQDDQHHNYKDNRKHKHSYNHNLNHEHPSPLSQPTPTQSPAPRKPLKPSSRHDTQRTQQQLDSYLSRTSVDTRLNIDPQPQPIRRRSTPPRSTPALDRYLVQHTHPTSLHQLPVHPHLGPVASVQSPDQRGSPGLTAFLPSTPPHTPQRAPQHHLLQEALNSLRKVSVGRSVARLVGWDMVLVSEGGSSGESGKVSMILFSASND